VSKAAFLIAALSLLVVSAPADDARADVPGGPSQLRAQEVRQPDGWDSDLVLPQPEDLNPHPDVLEFNLEARIAEIEFVPGVKTRAWTYNGLLPGPYIRAKLGDTVIVHFRNSLPEATTIHWHGLRVPNNMDGAPG
jgi:FtsP/CotA-like multicopper oxidase with cupredoxin domain